MLIYSSPPLNLKALGSVVEQTQRVECGAEGGQEGGEKRKEVIYPFPQTVLSFMTPLPREKACNEGVRRKTMGRYSRPTVAGKPAAPARPRKGCDGGG